MKNLKILIIVTLFVTFYSFIKCSDENSKDSETIKFDTLSFSHSMKGWELYSWPDENDWNYSLLIGTNRLKTYYEVTSNKIVVFGGDSLKMLLNKLPKNEEIIWIGEGWLIRNWGSNYKDLSLPESKIINEIKDYCNQKELGLNISN